MKLRNNPTILALFFFLMNMNILFAQQEYEYFPEEEEISEVSEIADELQYYLDNPLQINSAGKNELNSFPLFSKEDVKKIMALREKQPFSDKNDLIKQGFSEEFAESVLPYISFHKKAKTAFSSYTRSGYRENDQNLSSSLSLLQKNYLQYNNYELFLTSEKDAGEKNLLDFYNWTVSYSSEKLLRSIILGKFKASLGQGIVFSSNLTSNKGQSLNSFLKSDKLKPYTSAYEMWDMEGLALEATYRKLGQRLFFAQCKLDAYIKDEEITSFIESGIHIDDRNKDNTKEHIFCSNTTFNTDNSDFGVIFTGYGFNRYFSDSGLERENYITSLYGNYMLRNSTFFGEAALVEDKKAFLGGALFRAKDVRQLLIFRHYDKYFPTWHGSPFATTTDFDNETGVFLKNEIILKNMEFITYFDIWQHPETRYYEKMTTTGNEESVSCKIRFRERALAFSWKRKQHEHYTVVDDNGKVRETRKENFRVEWSESITNHIEVKNRFEHVLETFSEDGIYLHGNMFYTQLEFRVRPVSMLTRITAYKTDVVMYQYENTVLSKSDYAILNGEGIRGFLIIKGKPLENIDIQFKYSTTLNAASDSNFTIMLKYIL